MFAVRNIMRGIYMWCDGCGHGGHAKCMTAWFQRPGVIYVLFEGARIGVRIQIRFIIRYVIVLTLCFTKKHNYIYTSQVAIPVL